MKKSSGAKGFPKGGNSPKQPMSPQVKIANQGKKGGKKAC